MPPDCRGRQGKAGENIGLVKRYVYVMAFSVYRIDHTFADGHHRCAALGAQDSHTLTSNVDNECAGRSEWWDAIV